MQQDGRRRRRDENGQMEAAVERERSRNMWSQMKRKGTVREKCTYIRNERWKWM